MKHALLENAAPRKKSEETSLKVYGTRIPSQSESVWRKGQETTKEKYGYASPFEIPEIYQKGRDTFIKNFDLGKHSHLFYSEISQEFCKNLLDCLNDKIKNHTHFATYRGEYRIDYRKENNQIGHYFYDFCITTLKIIIEFQGVYWHRKPEIYEPNDSNIRKWKEDEHKKLVAEQSGFEVLYIWEDDYCKNKKESVQYFVNLITNKYEKMLVEQRGKL
jgi:very-short-patch-repair endonuclease